MIMAAFCFRKSVWRRFHVFTIMTLLIRVIGCSAVDATTNFPGTTRMPINSSEFIKTFIGVDLPVGPARKPKGYEMKVFNAINEINIVDADQSVVPKVRFTKMHIGNVTRKRRYRKRIRFEIEKPCMLYPPRSYYEIVLKNATNSIHRLPLIAKVKTDTGRRGKVIARHFHDFLIFNVSGIVTGSERRVTCRFFLSTCNNKTIKINGENDPMLVTYEQMNENPLFKNENSRLKRDNDFWSRRNHGLTSRTRSHNAPHCQRRPWNLNMEVFDYNWYIYPMHFDAGVCIGSCPTPLESERLNTTNYAFIKNLYHAALDGMDESVPKACCVPTEYVHLTVYYINSREQTVITSLPNMKVTACGCR